VERPFDDGGDRATRATTPRLEGLTPPTPGHGNLCRDNRTRGSPPGPSPSRAHLRTYTRVYVTDAYACTDMDSGQRGASLEKREGERDERRAEEDGDESARSDVHCPFNLYS